MNTLKRFVSVVIISSALTFVHLAGPAAADDGICGGIGTFDPVSGQCV